MPQPDRCPLCQHPESKVTSPAPTADYRIDCPRCGQYRLEYKFGKSFDIEVEPQRRRRVGPGRETPVVGHDRDAAEPFPGARAGVVPVAMVADEVRVDDQPVDSVEQGVSFSIKVPEKIRASDKLYKIVIA